MDKSIKALVRINYWSRTPKFDLGYIRPRYNNAIEASIGNRMIKVIVGQRRSGKSYIIRQLINTLIKHKKVNKKNLFYLNMEMFEFSNIRTADDFAELISLYKETYSIKGKVYIFIDEVQNIDGWEKIVVSLAQHPIDEYEVFITGSNSKLLSGELATLLSGRYIKTEVFPFSYREFLDYKKLKNNKENFIDYITTSALPEVYNFESEETKRYYFQSLKDTILLKDIMHRHKIRDYVLLEDIFLFLVHNVGNMTSIPSIVKYFKSKNRKADYATISSYISFMQDAFIIKEASRFSLKTKELLSGEKKYFVNDLGFRNFLYPNLIEDIGSILENIVFTHLRMAGFETKLGFGNNFEIDFFATNNIESQYVQVSYVMPTKKTIDREFGALEKVKDNLPKYVVSMDDILLKNDKGIIHKQVWNYLLELV